MESKKGVLLDSIISELYAQNNIDNNRIKRDINELLSIDGIGINQAILPTIGGYASRSFFGDHITLLAAAVEVCNKEICGFLLNRGAKLTQDVVHFAKSQSSVGGNGVDPVQFYEWLKLTATNESKLFTSPNKSELIKSIASGIYDQFRVNPTATKNDINELLSIDGIDINQAILPTIGGYASKPFFGDHITLLAAAVEVYDKDMCQFLLDKGAKLTKEVMDFAESQSSVGGNGIDAKLLYEWLQSKSISDNKNIQGAGQNKR